jgi:predicted RNA-binding Zn-ribbon protein involved in translation (DUF1610 family)
MSEESRKKWLEAGKTLAVNPYASVLCPDCGKASLKVLDARSGDLLERWMQCPVCLSKNTIRNPINKNGPQASA